MMTRHTKPYYLTTSLNQQDVDLILRLRLLIARAAGTDSLHWWDDESFTKPAQFIFSRLFTADPLLTSRGLALEAAQTRHEALRHPQVVMLHLFRLAADNEDRLALRFEPLLPIPIVEQPILSMSELREHLVDLLGEPMPYTIERKSDLGGVQLGMPLAPAHVNPMLHRAKTLAWAYLEGQPRQPVIPCCLASEK